MPAAAATTRKTEHEKPGNPPEIAAPPLEDPGTGAIERLAYTYWEERGRPHGSSEEDWLRAEQTIREGRDH